MARKGIVMTFVVGLLASTLTFATLPVAGADNPVVTENQQPGSAAWKLTKTADDVNNQIKGYAALTSVLQGGSISFSISVNPAQAYTIDVYRIGYYAALGGRLRLHDGPFNGTTQAACVPDATTGMIACNWPASYTLTIPADWTSGVYLAVLTNAAGYQNYINFVVRDGRPAAFLYQEGVNTAQAYNNYPNDKLTGKSLYEFNSYGANTIAGTTRAVKVSFDRPYANDGSGQFLSWEVQLVRWLEHSGYDVTYSTDVDTHANGAELLKHKAFFSAGHDEYWSNEMYNAAQTARDAGVNLAFWGANAIYWQARFEASAAGVANRVMVCYKSATLDSGQGPLTTVRWRDTPVNRPEQVLMGVMFTSEVASGNNVPYVVMNSSHWAYNGTGFHDGDSVAGIVGYEMDRYISSYPSPSNLSWTLLSKSPFTNTSGLADYANSSIYEASSKAWVFATGTMSWSWALDNFRTTVQMDPRIQQTSVNVLSAFMTGAPVVHDLKVTAPASATAGQAFTVSVIAENDVGATVTSYTGTVHFASSDVATGVSLPADSPLTNGAGSFSVTLMTPGAQTLTVSDSANNLSTTSNVTVNSPAASKLVITAPASAVAGQPFSITVTAQDASGNTVPSYSGTVHFASTDSSPGVSLPADSPLTNGQGTFSVTLIKAGAQTLTASDAANNISGTANLAVIAAPASKLALASGTTTSPAGNSFSFTVTALDPFGNTDTNYAGTIHFNSTDPSPTVSLPADSTLTSGQGTFSAALDKAGTQTITGRDTANASISGSLSIQITPLAASSLSLAVPSSAVVNQPFNVTVTLQDRYGNVATGYRGTVYFSSSDLVAMQLGKMPADYAFTAQDAGVHTFSATLMTPPSQTITVADTANSALSATSPPIAISAI